MEAARQAVKQFTSRRGHTTDVEEFVLPAVTVETIKPTRHEIITQAVDREVHQHHYHITAQPLSHTERLPTRHTHNLIPVQHVQHDIYRARNRETEAMHAAQLAQFQHSSTVHPTRHTQAQLPTVVAEHHHHHVHETLQPVIYKEVHAREIVHTTAPVHEIHYIQPVHHKLSSLPVATAAQLRKLGASITTGMKASHNYDGPPRPYRPDLETSLSRLDITKPAPIVTSSTRRHRKSSASGHGAGLTTPPLSPTTGRRSSSASSSPSLPATPKHNRMSDDVNLHSGHDNVYTINNRNDSKYGDHKYGDSQYGSGSSKYGNNKYDSIGQSPTNMMSRGRGQTIGL